MTIPSAIYHLIQTQRGQLSGERTHPRVVVFAAPRRNELVRSRRGASLRSLLPQNACDQNFALARRHRPLVPKEYVGTVSSAALLRFALFRDRFFDLLLTDGLQLLILGRAKNLLQLRCAFVVDGPQLLHLLYPGERSIVLDRLDFGTLCLEDWQHLALLLGRKLQLFREGFQLRRRVRRLARSSGDEVHKRRKTDRDGQQGERFFHACDILVAHDSSIGLKSYPCRHGHLEGLLHRLATHQTL